MSEGGVERFLDALAAGPPGPAAGSAAAVAVAMAASLLEMAATRSRDEESAAEAAELRARALALATRDEEAVTAMLAASGDARERALARATDVPRQIAAVADEVWEAAATLLDRAKRDVRGDVRAATILADAGRHVAAELVAANVGDADGWALSRRFELRAGEIAWDVFGQGPPIVLVHGTPSWSYLWRNIVPPLSKTFAVYVYDLLGYGASRAADDAEISIASHAETFVELLDRWQLDEPGAAGHDIGGATVLRAHLVHRRRLSRIALLDAAVLTPWITPTTRHVQTHLDAYRTMPRHVFDRITASHLRTAVRGHLSEDAFEAYQRAWRGGAGQEAYLRKVAGFDERHTQEFEPFLASIEVPVRIVWGDSDAWLEPTLGERLRRLIPTADLRIVPAAGHFSMEDVPREVAEALVDFFAGGADS